MPLTACHTCGRPTPDAYCDAHRDDSPAARRRASWRPGRGTAANERIRQAVFARDGHACVHCGSTEHLEAGHIVPHVADGPFTLDNLQTECRRCNRRKGAGTEVPA